jgi:hypothetical protein
MTWCALGYILHRHTLPILFSSQSHVSLSLSGHICSWPYFPLASMSLCCVYKGQRLFLLPRPVSAGFSSLFLYFFLIHKLVCIYFPLSTLPGHNLAVVSPIFPNAPHWRGEHHWPSDGRHSFHFHRYPFGNVTALLFPSHSININIQPLIKASFIV